jgi:hypothetical protein
LLGDFERSGRALPEPDSKASAVTIEESCIITVTETFRDAETIGDSKGFTDALSPTIAKALAHSEAVTYTQAISDAETDSVSQARRRAR